MSPLLASLDLAAFARFGRLHPLLLHLPIGLLFGALLLELFVRRGQLARPAYGLYLWLAAAAALCTAASGWVLGHEDGYGGTTLVRHERLGIAIAALALLAAGLHDASGRSRRRLALQRVCLVAACVLLLPAGDLGSTLTHGEDWLDGPRPRVAPVAPPVALPPAPSVTDAPPTTPLADGPPLEADPPPAPASTYATLVAPILAERCGSCHGAAKHKGGLRLHTAEGLLAGGDSGPALVPGDVAASLFLQRAELPLEHEDHMPPEGKPQPSAAELAVLVAWVAAGAPFEGPFELTAPPPAGTEEKSEEARAPAPAPSAPELGRSELERSELARAALTRALVHHEPVRPEGRALRVEVAAVAAGFGDAEFARLLLPLSAEIEELSLARSAIGEATLAELARFPRLVRLDLRATGVDDAALARLAGHATLEELVLVQTHLGEGAVDTLLALPRLARVALWRSGIGAAGRARLAAERPSLLVNSGEEALAAALESEGELAFSSDRPLPGAELVPLDERPINATCPVSGSPVNPEHTLVHEGRVIGFCCPNCPRDFAADPARFADKLP